MSVLCSLVGLDGGQGFTNPSKGLCKSDKYDFYSRWNQKKKGPGAVPRATTVVLSGKHILFCQTEGDLLPNDANKHIIFKVVADLRRVSQEEENSGPGTSNKTFKCELEINFLNNLNNLDLSSHGGKNRISLDFCNNLLRV